MTKTLIAHIEKIGKYQAMLVDNRGTTLRVAIGRTRIEARALLNRAIREDLHFIHHSH